MKLSKILSIAVFCLLPLHAIAADHSDHVDKVAQAVSDSSQAAASVANTAVTTTGGVINKIVDKASAGLAQITSKLESGAPAAWRLVVAGTKAKAEAGLTVGTLCAIWAFLMWLVFYNVASKADWCNGNKFVFPSIVFGISALTASIGTSVILLNSDTWAAFFSPDGYLAVQILQTALSH